MFAQPVTYQSYDNEPRPNCFKSEFGKKSLCFRHFLVELEFLALDI